MIGIDAKETIEFVSSKDTGEPKTIFLIGSFTNREKMRIFGGSMDSNGNFDPDKFQGKIFDVLKAGVKGIRNLAGKDYDSMTEEILEGIPFDILLELFKKIFEVNSQTEQEEKN